MITRLRQETPPIYHNTRRADWRIVLSQKSSLKRSLAVFQASFFIYLFDFRTPCLTVPMFKSTCNRK